MENFLLYEVKFNQKIPIIGLFILSKHKLYVPDRNYHSTIEQQLVLFSLKFFAEIEIKEQDYLQLHSLNKYFAGISENFKESNVFTLMNYSKESKLELNPSKNTFEGLIKALNINDDNQIANKSILELIRSLKINNVVSRIENMILTTTYNLKHHQKYRFIGFDSKHTVDDPLISYSNSEEKYSIRKFVKEKYEKSIEDSAQPLIRALPFKKTEEVLLAPEFCEIIFENFEMVKKVHKYLQIASDHHQKLIEFQNKIGIHFDSQILLRQCFIKPSIYNFKGNKFHNERLEFLGDAVLDLIVSQSLFDNLTTSSPGTMTKLHHLITKNDTLSHIGFYLGFTDIIMGNIGYNKKPNADCLEAFIGGLFLDQGISIAKNFIEKHILCLVDEMISNYTSNSLKYYSKHTFENPTVINRVDKQKIRFHFKKISELEKDLGFEFNNKFIILEALTHGKSFLDDEYRKKLFQLINNFVAFNYERFEFLGDTVLKFVSVVYLYQKFPELSENQLADIKSILVSNVTLEPAGIKLQKYVRTKNQNIFDQTKSNKSQSVKKYISDIFESIVGAIYLDQGGFSNYSDPFILDIKNNFIEKNLLASFFKDETKVRIDPTKSILQKNYQKYFKFANELPIYEVLGSVDSNEKKIFIMGLYFRNYLVAIDEGSSKKVAETNVAQKGIFIFNQAELLNLPIEKVKSLDYIVKQNKDLFISQSMTSPKLKIEKHDQKFLESIKKMKELEDQSKYKITQRFSMLGRENERELLYFYAVDYKPK
eukprot:gene1876-1017_t